MTNADFKDFAAIAPIGTFVIAAIATTVAFMSLQTQKRIARGRATIDFFIKAEMDIALRSLYDKYLSGIDLLQQTDIQQFARKQEYQDVRNYLDIMELMAIGVNHKVFDESICRGFWESLIARACKSANSVIQHTKSEPNSIQMYDEVVKLNRKWTGRH